MNTIPFSPTDENLLKSSGYMDYFYYKNIVINHEQVDGLTGLQNFPVLISLVDSDLKAHAQLDGDDIAFYIGTTQLDHEIEIYNPNYFGDYTQLVAWVRIPFLSGSEDTTIRMQYGNPTIGSQQNRLGVWNSDYKGIWHLSQNPAGTILDSSSNNIVGSSRGTMTASNQINGIDDGDKSALNFDGVNDYIDFGDFSGTMNTMTVSFWMKADAKKAMNPIDKFPADLTGPYGWSVRLQSDGSLTFFIGNTGNIGNDYVRVSNAYSANSWLFVTCTYSLTNAYIFLNGINKGSTALDQPRDINDNNIPLRFGIPADYQTSYRYDGVLDEVKLSKIVRSDSWIKTEFNNQKNPDAFYTISQEVNLGYDPNNPFNIDVKEGNQYIYELIEKNDDFKDFLPHLHELVNATYWMALLNYTQHMDLIHIDNYGDLIPIEAYFDIAYRDVLGERYTVSYLLKSSGYPEILGISEWYGSDLNFGLSAIGKIINGTSTLPALVGENQLGTGVLEYLDLYDSAQNNNTIKLSMLSGYGLGTTLTNWYKLQALAEYYREYFIPEAIPLLEPIAIYQFPVIQYVDVMDKLFEGNEVKGDFSCSEIKEITNFTVGTNLIGWNVSIDKWDFSSNKQDFNTTPADNIQNLTVFCNTIFLGDNINVASLSLQDQDIIPIIVDIYLDNISWTDTVKRYGNTISEIFYSGPIEPYPYEEINLTYSMTYGNDGMINRISFYGNVQVSTHLVERVVFYELALVIEDPLNNPELNPNDDGSSSLSSNILDSRIIVLSSVSLTFALGLLYVLKKSKGLRR